jgi:hypothetical protein
MLLDASDIQEFKQIYEEEYKQVLTEAKAEEMASRVIQIYQLLAQPLPGEESQHPAPSRAVPDP